MILYLTNESENQMMKEEYKDFIGIYDESIPTKLCDEFVKNYETAKKNSSIIDLSEKNVTGMMDTSSHPSSRVLDRRDEGMFVAPLLSSIYPRPPVDAYFGFLTECFKSYKKRYSIEFGGALYNDVFKIHKVRKSEGYHRWHYEKGNSSDIDRLMVYMTYLEVPKKGGETEFLHQSLRIDPVVGRTLIWPAGYTHMHRGLMPLDVEKMYISGWITGSKINFDDAGK